MKRIFALVLLAALGAAVTPAQSVTHATAKIAFIKVKNADGSTTEFRGGGTFPVTIRQIDAVPVGTLGRVIPRPKGLFERGRDLLGVNTTVYQNMEQALNFVAANGASCLDDKVHIASGNNKAWKIVTFGVHLADNSRNGEFLVRWRGFDTYTAGLGPNVMAFSGEYFDFGFYLDRADFPPTAPEDATFAVTGDLTLNPVFIVPNQICYMAQQFREPHPGGPSQEDGEQPFTMVWNVFANNGPQIGSSEDMFWYDSPADGVYDETEVDMFDPKEGGEGAGNFLFTAEVASGNTTTVSPFSATWFRGNPTGGNVGSLWFDDSSYMTAKAGLVLFPSEPPAQLVVETFSPTQNPAGLRFDVNAKVNTPGLAMRIELFNFSTNQYVQVWQGAATMSDQSAIGFATTPPQYVSSGGLLRAKVSFLRTGLTLLYPWTASVDMVRWTVTSP
jgi:hypothetical protein